MPASLDEIAAIPKTFLTATDIAPYLGSSPITIRAQAHECPEKLGFPVTIIKRRVKIPKDRFVEHFRKRTQP